MDIVVGPQPPWPDKATWLWILTSNPARKQHFVQSGTYYVDQWVAAGGGPGGWAQICDLLRGNCGERSTESLFNTFVRGNPHLQTVWDRIQAAGEEWPNAWLRSRRLEYIYAVENGLYVPGSLKFASLWQRRDTAKGPFLYVDTYSCSAGATCTNCGKPTCAGHLNCHGCEANLCESVF